MLRQKKKEYLSELQKQIENNSAKVEEEKWVEQTERCQATADSKGHTERLQQIRDRKLQQLR